MKDKIASILRNQRGNSFVEAAMVFPLIILALVAIVLAMVFLFNCNINYSKGDRILLNHMGRENKVFSLSVPRGSGTITSEFRGSRPSYIYTYNTTMGRFGILRKKEKTIATRIYNIDEKEDILADYFVRGALEDVKDNKKQKR